MITHPFVIVLLHIATLVGAIATFGPIFGGLFYAIAVIMIQRGELT